MSLDLDKLSKGKDCVNHWYSILVFPRGIYSAAAEDDGDAGGGE